MDISNSREKYFLPHLVRRSRFPIPSVQGIPSHQLDTARSFTALSDKLNVVEDQFIILREAVDGVMAILEAKAGLVSLASPVDLTYSGHRTYSESLSRFERTLREQKGKLLDLFSLEPQKRIHKIEEMTVIPLSWHSRTIGLIAFDCDGKNIAEHQEAGLLSFCNQLAAIFGLRGFSRPSASYGEVALRYDEVERAVAVQQSLQPVVPSSSCGLSIATYIHAAEYVAGDYFDLILVDKNKMGIVIADVEGKGISAALFTNLLRTTVHFLTRESFSTACVVGKIDAILHKETSSIPRLFTLFYAIFDAESKILTYTGSGHVQPIVVRAGNSATERLPSDGMPVGIEIGQHFSERSIQLLPGDLVVYFTDGLIDIVDKEGNRFGEERFVELLRKNIGEHVERIVRNIVSEIAAFAPGPPSDDLTIIVTKVMDQ